MKTIIIFLIILIILILLWFVIIRENNKYNEQDFNEQDFRQIIDNIDNFCSSKNFDISEKINIPIYYINLNRSEERNEFIKFQVKNSKANITRIEAVDGNNIEDLQNGVYTFSDGKEITYKLNYKDKQLTKYEVGCIISHFKAIYESYSNNDDYALIIEDDIYLLACSNWEKNILEIISELPEDWGLVQLYSNIDYKKIKNKNFTIWEQNNWSNAAYIINRKTMKQMLNLFDGKNINIDYKKEKLNHPEADYMMYKYLQNNNIGVYSYKPILFTLNNKLKSYIHDDHTYLHNKVAYNHSKNLILKIGDYGKALEYGGDFIKLIIEKAFDKPILYTQKRPDFYVVSHFGNKYKHEKPYITWSGEPERVKNDDKSFVNVVSFLPEKSNDIWVPYILFHITPTRINKLITKNFRKMKDRKFFLIHLFTHKVERRENLFSNIKKLRNDAHDKKDFIKYNPNDDRNSYDNNGDVFENYRFVVAMENTMKDGYITEKILNAYLSGAIPIYSGGKSTVEKFFAKGTYINVDEFSSLKICAEYICELDKSIDKLQKIQDTNIFLNNEVHNMFKWYEKDNEYTNSVSNFIREKIKNLK